MGHATHTGHATHEQVFGLASMVDFGHATRHERSRKSETSWPAGLQQVSSRFRTS